MDTAIGILRWLAFASDEEDVMKLVKWGAFFSWFFLYLSLLLVVASGVYLPLSDIFRNVGFLTFLTVILPIAAVVTYRFSIDDRVVPKWKHQEELDRAFYRGVWDTIRKHGESADNRSFETPAGRVIIYIVNDLLELVPEDADSVDIKKWREFRANFLMRVGNVHVDALDSWKRALES